MEYRIQFVNSQKEITAEEGCLLSDAMHRAGIHLDMPCGGKGSCGKCTVKIEDENGACETVRACSTQIRGPLKVWEKISGDGLTVLTDGASSESASFDPMVVCNAVVLEQCAIGGKASAVDKLSEALGFEYRPEPVTAAQLSRVGTGLVYVVSSSNNVLGISREQPKICTAAFDIGTTTIAGYLIDEHGRIIATNGMLNPQTEYGADVISRVDYSMEHGTETLMSIVRSAVNALLGKLCVMAGIERGNVYTVSIVGNTCMHHLFLGLLPVTLGKAPFSPVLRETLIRKCSEFGIEAAPAAELILLPVIAGFIGADTVGCAVAVDFDRMEKKTLLIDIGTNGELIMGTKERMIACSTAAGPAFEGAKISMGMRGMNGAIDHVSINKDGKICAHVIGDCEAIGICGSGLVDAVSVLLKEEIIDEMGHIDNGSYQFEGTNVVITQKDVREIQLAKAAIQAGIRLMAEQLGWVLEDIDQVLIAGAFGNYMDPECACDIGLIPEELRGKIRGIGNAAGEGAQKILMEKNALQQASALAERIEFLELATLKAFQDTFVDALTFGEWEE